MTHYFREAFCKPMNHLTRDIFISVMLVTVIAGYDIAHDPTRVKAMNVEKPVPTASPKYDKNGFGPTIITKVVIGTPTPKPKTVPEKITATFGKDHIMHKVAKCESGLRPTAKNPKGTATGIFQIIKGTWNHYKCEGDRTNPDDNIQCAKKIFDKEGLRPWVSSQGCWGVTE